MVVQQIPPTATRVHRARSSRAGVQSVSLRAFRTLASTSASSLAIGKLATAWIGRMMTALVSLRTFPPTQSDVPAASHVLSPARLKVRAMDHRGFVDGGWWPRSTDLMAELPSLIAATPCEGFDVAQLVYSVTAWDVTPEKLFMARRPVRLMGYRGPNTSTICLADSSGRRSIVLAVIPPHTERTAAEFALKLAGLDGDRHRAAEILEWAASDASPPTVSLTFADRLPWARWETDGGRVLTS
jgi:hypothetical protein